MNKYFKDFEYNTDQNKKRVLIDKLFLNTRWYFIYRYVKVVLWSRNLAKKEEYDEKASAESSFQVLQAIEDCGGKIHISGMENIVNDPEPVVFIGNHMSTLETMVFPCLIIPTKKTSFVAKSSLANHPLIGPVLTAQDPIIVNRSDSKEDYVKVINEGKKLLNNGTSVIIFPQSTRSVVFNSKKFNTLGVKLAKKAGVKAVPVALKTNFWGHGRFLKDLGKINRNEEVYIKFGKSIEIKGSGKEENKIITNFISDNLKQWGVPII